MVIPASPGPRPIGPVPLIPAPPHPFDPTPATLSAGARLYRVHPLEVPEVDDTLTPTGQFRNDDGTLFNPGFGTTRFAFFGHPKVPVWYAASGPEGAVYESLLHDKTPGGSVPRAEWSNRMLSVVRTTHDLRLAKFHSDGLRKFNLTAADLTDTPPTTYPDTVHWAHEAWKAGYDGCVWVSRQYNSQLSYVLFGTVTINLTDDDTPIDTGDTPEIESSIPTILGPELGAPPIKLRAAPEDPETRVFALNRHDYDWLAKVCLTMNVTTTL